MSILQFSLLEIKRADQVDVLSGMGRNIFDDVGGYAISDGLLLSVHTRQQQGVMVDRGRQ
jgi:hypothetical protein